MDILACALSAPATLDTELDRDNCWGSENCELRRDRVAGLPSLLLAQALPFMCLVEYTPGDSIVVMASNDLASVVISASTSDEMSHMTVLMVVRFRRSLGGTTTSPSSGMETCIPSGGA
jgi:hypothetical protein